jgi:hypothetical protein
VGDSPTADATLMGNETFGNLFGVLIRNALGGKAVANSIHGNCDGVAVFADSPGPAGLFHFNANRIHDNTKAWPASGDLPFPLSGVGMALVGASGVKINGNRITGNVPSGDTTFSGGVVLASGFGGTPPTNNRLQGNHILGNDPDIFWDETGSGNIFKGNNCDTSSPVGLCR